MTRFTPCTLQISLSTALHSSSLSSLSSTSSLHMATGSSQFYPLPSTTTTPPHAAIHCVFFCQHVLLSSAEALARYVNDGNRIVAFGEASFTKFPVNFTLIHSAVACRPAACVSVHCRTRGVFVCLGTFSSL